MFYSSAVCVTYDITININERTTSTLSFVLIFIHRMRKVIENKLGYKKQILLFDYLKNQTVI